MGLKDEVLQAFVKSQQDPARYDRAKERSVELEKLAAIARQQEAEAALERERLAVAERQKERELREKAEFRAYELEK